MRVELTRETHSVTEANEAGVAAGWLDHLDDPSPGAVRAHRRVVEATRDLVWALGSRGWTWALP